MKFKLLILILIFLSGCNNFVDEKIYSLDATEEKIEMKVYNTPELFLTFDDFPCQKEKNIFKQRIINETILKTLKKHKTKCIVFANASGMMSHISEQEEVLRLWLKNGHSVGNHTFSHPALSYVSAFDYKLDIIKGEHILQKVLSEFDQKLIYFRYPYLDYGAEPKKSQIRSFLKLKGYEIVGITIDTIDWSYNAKMYNGDLDAVENYKNHVKNEMKHNIGKRIKDTILFHINLINAKCLDEIVEYAKKIGYKLSK